MTRTQQRTSFTWMALPQGEFRCAYLSTALLTARNVLFFLHSLPLRPYVAKNETGSFLLWKHCWINMCNAFALHVLLMFSRVFIRVVWLLFVERLFLLRFGKIMFAIFRCVFRLEYQVSISIIDMTSRSWEEVRRKKEKETGDVELEYRRKVCDRVRVHSRKKKVVRHFPIVSHKDYKPFISC